MFLATSSYLSAPSLAAISLAALGSALVNKELEFCALNTMPYPIPLETFTDCIFAQPIAKRALRIVAFELLKDISPLSPTVRATLGLLGHQYNVATVLLGDGRKTHIRVDYNAFPPSGSSSRLSLHLDDDYDRLTRDSQLLSRVATPAPAPDSDSDPDPRTAGAPAGFLTLGGLAALFRVAQQEAAQWPYDVFVRNCFWMSESLFYSVAKRFAREWLTTPGAKLTPRRPLERFLRGECGVVDAASATQAEAARSWARTTEHVVRVLQMVLDCGGKHQFKGHDEELDEWIADWERHSYYRDVCDRDSGKFCW